MTWRKSHDFRYRVGCRLGRFGPPHILKGSAIRESPVRTYFLQDAIRVG
jgi:hypothetical protein